MITIREGIANKIPTTTSLYISFDFNQDIINFLGTLELSIFNKKDGNWEVPLTDLGTVIDNLRYIDDITLDVLDDDTAQETLPMLSYKTNPFPYQLEGIKYGLNHNKWMLLDEPGLGKTLQIIYLAEELHARGEIEHCLIICGVNTLKTNWENEIHKHSKLDCVVLGKKLTSKGNSTYASVQDRIVQLKNRINEFFIITNIETLRNSDFTVAFNTSVNKIDMIVVDECHKAKDPTSLQSQGLMNLEAKYKIAATGTLIMNNPLDCFVALKWTDHLNSGITNFKKYFCEMGGRFSKYEITGFKHLDVLQSMINSCSLRRKSDLLKDLPEKTVINEWVDMSDEHSKIYNQVLDGIRSNRELSDVSKDIDKVKLIKGNLLTLAVRLRQATSCPQVLTTTPVKSSKIDRAQDLAEQIVSNGNKVIISCSFKESVYDLANRLKQYNPLVATGDSKQEDVDKVIHDFQNDDTKKILIFTWQKMGVGLTLTAANYMICVDTAYTAADQDQTERRIYRIGASKPVFIYRLFCNNTWDAHCLSLLEGKQAVSDYLVDNDNTREVIEALQNYLREC